MKMISLMLLGLWLLTGCQTSDPQGDYAAGGAITGAVLGAIVGNNVGDGDNEVLGAVIGGVAGGVAGNEIGKGEAREQERLRALERRTNELTVMVLNSNGSATPVRLRKVGADQWRGPRGEIYYGVPTQEQLHPVYGF